MPRTTTSSRPAPQRVVIGMDPHKRSVTIEVMTDDETVLGAGRFDTTTAGYDAMLAHVTQWPDRGLSLNGGWMPWGC